MRSKIDWAVQIAAIALAYAAAGWAGLFLALPPGYAAPLWLPAGIALLAALLMGPRIALGVGGGSFLVNLWISSTRQGAITTWSVVLACGIALGAMLQALVGMWLVRRHFRLAPAPIRGAQGLWFLLQAGPISCLVNATWSVTWLFLTRECKWEDFAAHWVNWWVGDTLGVFVVTPVLLCLVGKPGTFWRPCLFRAAWPMAALVVVVALLFGIARQRDHHAGDGAREASLLALGVAMTLLVAVVLLTMLSEATAAAQEAAHTSDDLRQSEERFRTFFDLSLDFHCIATLDGYFRRVNATFEKVLGFTAEELCARQFVDFIHPEDVDATREAVRALHVGKEVIDFENRYRCKNGEYRWLQWRAVTRLELGLIYAVARDITEQKQHEKWRRENEERLREADRRKDEFLAMLAHELRNPLAPIRNSVEIMRLRGMSHPISERARDLIETQVTHLTRMIEDLLDVSRISRGKIALRLARTDLANVTRQAVDISNPLIEARGQHLTVTLPEGSLFLLADSARLAQVIANLLNNAAKYGKPGGNIWLTCVREERDVVICVRDDGIGIPAEMLGKIFELFVQVDTSLERGQGGLGIGLSLVQQLVMLHGGSVCAASEGVGKGSQFTVRLPVVVE